MISKKLALSLYWGLASVFAVASGLAPERAIAREKSATSLFRVEIDGTDRELLERVRAVEPEAFVKSEENIIQAGLFGERSKAKRLAKALKRSGVRAQVVRVERPLPATVAAAPTAPELFRVEVAGADRELLERVKILEPTAFVRSGGRAIQVGLFSDVTHASQLVANLELLDIPAQVVSVQSDDRLASGTLPPAPDSGVSPGTELNLRTAGDANCCPAHSRPPRTAQYRIRSLNAPKQCRRWRVLRRDPRPQEAPSTTRNRGSPGP